jgi:hypothetical protein
MPSWLPSNLWVRLALVVVLVCLVAYTAGLLFVVIWPNGFPH